MIIYLLTNFFIGSCIASHACVIYERYDCNDFILSRSCCKSCNYELSLLDEIPIISFLLLKGKCKYCENKIPANLFLAELIGGFVFIKIDFSSYKGLTVAIILSILLIISIFDYKDKEFPTILLLLPFFIILTTKIEAIRNCSILDLIEFFPITILLIVLIFKQKLGAGDLFIYWILALYFSPIFANSAFLIASILLITHYFLEKQNEVYPFIPYIFLATIFQLLLE